MPVDLSFNRDMTHNVREPLNVGNAKSEITAEVNLFKKRRVALLNRYIDLDTKVALTDKSILF